MGDYTRIIAVRHPTRAAAGDIVTIEVDVQNIKDWTFQVFVAGQYPGGEVVYFEPQWPAVDPGQIQTFTASFSMPNKDIAFSIFTYYWSAGEAHEDDFTYITIVVSDEPRYTKSARYVQPAWTMSGEFISGLYVNGVLFENNVLVRNATLRVKVKPSKHLRQRQLVIAMMAYQDGQVVPKTITMSWSWNQDHEKTGQIDFPNNFYGIGLNLIYVVSTVDMATDAPVIYNVDYALEVSL